MKNMTEAVLELSVFEIIRIHHECPCRIGKSHRGAGISTRDEACREGEISLSCMDWLMKDSFSSTFKWIIPRNHMIM